MLSEYIRSHSVRKGQPNLTAADVQAYVNSQVLPLLGNGNVAVGHPPMDDSSGLLRDQVQKVGLH